MNNIKGRSVRYNRFTIGGGKLINGGNSIFTKKFDERMEENAHNVEKLTINSTMADVSISVSNSQKVEAHVWGNAVLDGVVKFKVKKVIDEIIVTVDVSGNSFDGNLKLDVNIPAREFKQISVKTDSACVQLDNTLLSNELKVRTELGDIETNAIFKQAILKSDAGDVNVQIRARSNIELKVATMCGDIETTFENVGYINLSSKTKIGKIKNRHNYKGYYTANVDLSSTSGDIKII